MRIPLVREAYLFGLPLAFATAAGGWWWPPAGAAAGLLCALVVWFFRDPERRPPEHPDVVLAPADGKVIRVRDREFSIFMSPLDVHVVRAPARGRLSKVRHVPGRFFAAYRDEAQEHNERVEMAVDTRLGRIAFTLVAGLLARRIVPWVEQGDAVQAGQRVALIRFGSRVDVALPEGVRLEVRAGMRLRAGESIVARVAAGSVEPAGAIRYSAGGSGHR